MPRLCPDIATIEHPAVALLARETRWRAGPVPRILDDVALADGEYILRDDRFLFRTEGGIGFYYRRGEGITLEQPAAADPRDVRLWLQGTTYAAVAAINGLFPLHASAVTHDGRVYAFAGPSGAGKSTLAAALGREGFPLFCDDTLILDLAGNGAVTGLPGHKRLKLWPDAFALARAERHEQVASDYDKYFARPAGSVITDPLPLAGLIFLDQGPDPALATMTPGERVARLQDDHYTTKLFALAGGPRSIAVRFDELARIVARIPMRRFLRPIAADRFDEGLRFIADYIRDTRAQ